MPGISPKGCGPQMHGATVGPPQFSGLSLRRPSGVCGQHGVSQERSFAQRRARRFPATGVNFPLCEIRAPRSVDQTNDLGLPQMPRGRGLNLSAR
jgi:hypothetical protein